MSEPCTDKELWSASDLLPKYIEMAYNIPISLICYEEEYGNSSRHSFPDEEFVEAFEHQSEQAFINISKRKARADELFPEVILKIKSNLHIFADISNIVDLDIKPLIDNKWDRVSEVEYSKPDNILGTSAHHAGVLFLEKALINSFWDDSEERFFYELPPEFDYKLLNVKIHQERLRVFRVSGNLPSSEIGEVFDSVAGVIEQFDDTTNIFRTDNGRVHFPGDVQYSLFKYIYQNRRASFNELKKNIPKWKKNNINDGAITQAKNRVNTDLANANLLNNEYELTVRKGHVLFRADVVDEGNKKST